MFNSTHILVGITMARAGFDRLGPYALWTAVIAANLPDIDIVTQFYGTGSYLSLHRGITHSMLAIPVLSLALAAMMHRVSGRFPVHFFIAFIAMASHPLLDYANTYGVRPFLPFDGRWFYGDIMFVIDPYFDAIPLAALVLTRFAPRYGKAALVVGLVFMAGYLAARIELRNMARRQLDSFAAGVPGYVRNGVSPRMLTPFTWTGIVETQDAVFSVPVNPIRGVGAVLDRIPKAPASPIVAAAEHTQSGSALAAFARFRVNSVKATSTGYRVVLMDYRFYREGSRTALAAIIDLNSSLGVVSETIGFNHKID